MIYNDSITTIWNLKDDNSLIDFDKSFIEVDGINQYFHIYLKHHMEQCPYCSSYNTYVRDTKKTNPIRHAKLGGEPGFLFFHKRRYICKKCNHIFSESFNIIQINRTTSTALVIEMLSSLKDYTNSYKKVAQRYHVSCTYIINEFDKCVDIKRYVMPSVLSIDEIYAKKLTRKKYCCVLVDPIHDTLIDVLNSRKTDFLENYFRHISLKERANIKYIVMDLYDPYKNFFSKLFSDRIQNGKVLLVADSFHVIKNLNEAFRKVRIRIMKEYSHLKKDGDLNYWYLKTFWKQLQKRRDKVKGRFKLRKFGTEIDGYKLIDDMLSVSKELKEAYQLKELYIEFNTVCEIEEVPEELDDLISRFLKSKSLEMRQFGRLIKKWRKEIINSFIEINGFRLSNSRTERKNRNIKTILRNSYGLSNFNRSRNRLMYSLNKDIKLSYNPNGKSNKVKGKKRKKYKK